MKRKLPRIYVVERTNHWGNRSNHLLDGYFTSMPEAKLAVAAHESHDCACKRNRPELCDFHKPWVKWKGRTLKVDHDGALIEYTILQLDHRTLEKP